MTYFLVVLICILAYALASSVSRNRIERRLHAISKQQIKENYEIVAKRHEHEFARLLDALPDPFISISEEGRIIRHNQPVAELFRGREILNRSYQQVLLDPGIIAQIEKARRNACAISTTLSFPPSSQFSIESLGKESYWKIDIRTLSLNRDTLEIQLIMRNITAEVQTDQIRKDFVANASHELRTPLSIIAGYLENLTEESGLDDKDIAKKMLTTMDRHVVRINRIVEDMLVISKLESNEGTPLKMESFNLASCVRDVVERLDLLIEKQMAKVSLKVPEITLTGDRFYWTQILFNLVENALKQNATTPVEVQIAAGKMNDGSTEITVSDNGIGIPSADLPFIFKRFFRVEKHHSQNQVKGTGLGLSIVKRAIEAHGGSIQATSTPGVRTTFTINLPKEQEIESAS